jgi:hypothetical protein
MPSLGHFLPIDFQGLLLCRPLSNGEEHFMQVVHQVAIGLPGCRVWPQRKLPVGSQKLRILMDFNDIQWIFRRRRFFPFSIQKMDGRQGIKMARL